MRACSLFFLLLSLFSLVAFSSQKGLECAVCQQFVGSIDKKEIEEDKNLKERMDKECREILEMKVVEAYCEKLVNQEFENILQKIQNDEKPDKICRDINMC